MNIFIKLLGMWLFSDAVYSLILYKGKGERFFPHHWIRWVRMLIGVIIMIWA